VRAPTVFKYQAWCESRTSLCPYKPSEKLSLPRQPFVPNYCKRASLETPRLLT